VGEELEDFLEGDVTLKVVVALIVYGDDIIHTEQKSIIAPEARSFLP
jgi:hypothetical protein